MYPLYALLRSIAFIMSFFKAFPLESKVFDNPIIGIHAKGMRFGGFLIDRKHKFKLLRFWLSALVTLSMTVCCGLQFGRLCVGSRPVTALSTATAFLYLTTSITTNNTFLRRKMIARLLQFLHNDLEKLLAKSDAIEQKLLKSTHNYVRILTTCIWSMSVMAAVIAYIDAFIRIVTNPDSIFNLEQVKNGTETEILLIKLFPFREVQNGLFVGYILPLYALLIGITIIPLWHTFVTSLMSYVLFKWNILHKRLSDMDISKVVLDEKESKMFDSIVNEEARINYLRTKLCKFCVIEQIRIRWFVQELQTLINIPVFADFIIFSILICFLFYELAAGKDFVFMCIYLFVMSSILWMQHWHATLIRERSDAMCFAIYSCDWYNYPVSVQKMVQMCMVITASPLEMKALFVTLNLTTFIDIIRAAYSYFSLLSNSS